MIKQPKGLVYREEFAKSGEGKPNSELWLTCARVLLGYDPRLGRKNGPCTNLYHNSHAVKSYISTENDQENIN